MPSLGTGDEILAYETAGSGPPLLLVSGLGGVGSFWRRVRPRLAQRFRVITYDHRGTGDSAKPAAGYSLRSMVADALRLLDHLGIERAHFVGQSTGGAISQRIAIEAPQRVDRLVLSATWGWTDALLARVLRFRLEVLAAMGAPAYVRSSSVFLYPGSWLAEHWTEHEANERLQIGRFGDAGIVRARIEALLQHDCREQLARIGARTLVTVARDDVLTPPYQAERLHASIEGARLRVFDAGGHLAPITVPDEYAAAVEAFLAAE